MSKSIWRPQLPLQLTFFITLGEPYEVSSSLTAPANSLYFYLMIGSCDVSFFMEALPICLPPPSPLLELFEVMHMTLGSKETLLHLKGNIYLQLGSVAFPCLWIALACRSLDEQIVYFTLNLFFLMNALLKLVRRLVTFNYVKLCEVRFMFLRRSCRSLVEMFTSSQVLWSIFLWMLAYLSDALTIRYRHFLPHTILGPVRSVFLSWTSPV